MTEARVEPHSLTSLLVAYILGMILTVLCGYLLALNYPPPGFSDLLLTVIVYMFVPVLVSTIGYFLGWFLKKRAVDYVAPNWEFTYEELTIDECAEIARNYPRKYPAIVAKSNMLYYIIPPFLIVFSVSSSIYISEYASQYLWLVPHMYAPIMGLTYLISILGAFHATMNAASGDFAIPDFREIIWLARQQSRVPGVDRVNVLLEKATYGDYEVYRNPRAIVRVKGLGNDALVRSVTTDIGSITRVTAWLRSAEHEDGIVWSWEAYDREFWKQSGSTDSGYYVRRPVASLGKEVGVRDVELVTRNAIAILVLEWLRINGDNPEMRSLLLELGVPPEEIDKRF